MMRKKRGTRKGGKGTAGTPLPHHGVYTRLGLSKVHGIGVLAIRDIPKGRYIFATDRNKMVEVDKKDIKNIPFELQKFYYDFCIFKGDTIWAPANFNRMTIGWYINLSRKNPNVAYNRKRDDFYALRRIRKGEELLTDYSTFTEEQENYKRG